MKLFKLSISAEYLLDKKNYDGAEHEEFRLSVIRAKEIIKIINSLPAPPETK